jgi:hypothetical protein
VAAGGIFLRGLRALLVASVSSCRTLLRAGEQASLTSLRGRRPYSDQDISDRRVTSSGRGGWREEYLIEGIFIL